MPRPDVTGAWHARILRSPWTYVLIFSSLLYFGCLRGLYIATFAQPRSSSGGAAISPATVTWFHVAFVVFAALLGGLIGAGALVLHHLRGPRRLAGMAVIETLLILATAWFIVTLIRPVKVGWVPWMTGVHGFGPYALYQLALSWGALTALAGFALWLLLRASRLRWWHYVGALVIVAAAVVAFFWCQFTMTAPLTIPYEADVRSKVEQCAGYAARTLAFWLVLFLAVDRWRPQRWILWFLALGWGACVSTYVSMYLNTWVGDMMANPTAGPGTQEGPAVYSAPFVEEASKATILFLLAAALRYRLTSRSSLFTLAGLSAAGFAFSENIIYYLRVFIAATQDPTAGDPEKALQEIVKLRGFFTAFGHELFTSLTAIGLIAAVSTRSKSVRVLAPLGGFMSAALAHMCFNGSSALITGDSARLRYTYLLIGVVVVLIMIGASILNWYRDGERIRSRLTDYVRMGWLPPADIDDLGRTTSRFLALSRSVFTWKPWRFPATVATIRTATELAFLRDGMTRGLISDAGLEREKELFDKLARLRPKAVLWSTYRRPKVQVAPVFVSQPGYAPGYAGSDRPWGPSL